ncbi:MAG: hypothetical protein OEW93_01835 [Candidatus Bathyarchaeota archaeon]|nr:hypothetical protein [Candidatus Bathyarchaeota archaeon]
MADVLAEPYDYLELEDGESLEVRIQGFLEGESVIRPRYEGAPETKRIPCLRLYAAPGAKPIGAPWWDVTSKTLIARLRPHLKDLAASKGPFTVTAYGSGRRKRFSVEIPGPGAS